MWPFYLDCARATQPPFRATWEDIRFPIASAFAVIMLYALA